METNNTIIPTIGQNIRKYRLARGLSNKELAEKSNISPVTLLTIEKKLVFNPRLSKTLRIAHALNLSINDLLYNTEFHEITTPIEKRN